jgi:hypothetical protein
LFGKRSDTNTVATSDAVDRSAFAASKPSRSADGSQPADKTIATQRGNAEQAAATERPIQKTKRKAIAGKARKAAHAPALVIAAVEEAPAAIVKRVPHPKKNAWSKLVAGRQITSILDTNLGDASRAVELLEAIVCDNVPTPKYVAIDDFDLAGGGTTVLQFHQRVRRVGGKAVPIPGAIDEGLRQLSRTIGTVDLVLVDEAKPQWKSEETRRLLERVTHPGSLVLCRDTKNNWEVVDRVTAVHSTVAKADHSDRKVVRAA